MKTSLKNIYTTLFFSFTLFFVSGLILSTSVSAVSVTFPKYDVDIEVNEDSTFTVTEDAIYKFNGSANGFRRDIPLYSAEKGSYCAENPDLSCGGFELIELLEVKLDGEILDEDEYDTYKVDYDNGSSDFRIEKRLWDEETYVYNEEFDIEITYKIYGGIAWLDLDGSRRPVFYWNTLPEFHELIDSSSIKIQMPDSVDISLENTDVYADDLEPYLVNTARNRIEIDAESILNSKTITVYYAFEEDEIIEPGGIAYTIDNPVFNNKIYIDDFLIGTENYFTINFFPAGKYTFKVDNLGYKPYTEEIEVKAGKTIEIETHLEPEAWMEFILFLGNAQFWIGLILIPFGIYKGVDRFNKKGKDINMPKTIIPQFSAPENTPPYLLGSIKDETVDPVDITASLIDLAYRGHLKIKEIKKKKNYELTKITNSKDTLNKIEEEIINAFFGSKDKIQTKDLTYSFVTKLEKIKNNIYDEMVDKNYFKESPKAVRIKNYGIGTGLEVFAMILLVPGSIGLSLLTSTYLFALSALPFLAYGLVVLITASNMPAKTELGSKVLAHIKGFKMYLETAEKYRVQNLTPENFEKFLSFAIVFGVEKQWANNFKDIYKGSPEWFEGDTTSFNTLYLANALNNLGTANTKQISSVTTAHNSSRGGGWSGGGGGFSGGGGGGGSAGGW